MQCNLPAEAKPESKGTYVYMISFISDKHVWGVILLTPNWNDLHLFNMKGSEVSQIRQTVLFK